MTADCISTPAKPEHIDLALETNTFSPVLLRPDQEKLSTVLLINFDEGTIDATLEVEEWIPMAQATGVNLWIPKVAFSDRLVDRPQAPADLWTRIAKAARSQSLNTSRLVNEMHSHTLDAMLDIEEEQAAEVCVQECAYEGVVNRTIEGFHKLGEAVHEATRCWAERSINSTNSLANIVTLKAQMAGLSSVPA